jgi:hypothetical protein
MCAPGKVFDRTVGGDSITMPTFHSGRTWADKDFQYKSVNQKYEVLPVFGQGYLGVNFLRRVKNSLGYISQGFALATAPIRPYATLIGNIISGEVGNRFPNFFGSVKILVIHGVALLIRVVLGREPFRCSSTAAARLFITT